MVIDHSVGILTFHRCVNHGSFWQARCLVDGLHARGHDAVILDHDSHRVNVAEWRCALQPTLPTPVPSRDRPLYRSKVHKFAAAVEGLPRSPTFDLHDPTSIDAYDTVVVGSDEVWNLQHPWYGGSALFFGVGLRARRLVSYAGSFGNYDAGQGLPAVWADRLRTFHAISVRDDNSREIVARAIGAVPAVVLDPCLLFPPSPSPACGGPDRPFILVYGHNFSPWFVDEIRRTASARGLVTVSVSYRNDWADLQWIDAGPHNFAHAMSRARAVATNFFHGCVFALLNRAPFVCETSAYRRNKIKYLLSAIGGDRHLVSWRTPRHLYGTLLAEPPDQELDRRIDALRCTSTAFLDASAL
jgi:Polysaccharide pyruvyl transferase